MKFKHKPDVFGFNPNDSKVFTVTRPGENHNNVSKMFINGKTGVAEAVVEIDKNNFSPGDRLSGVITLKNLERNNIQVSEVTIRGIEYGSPDNISRTSTIEEYKTNINWNTNTTGSLTFDIPTNAKKSFTGKYSKYYWEIEIFLETGFSSRNIRASNTFSIG